MSKTPGLQYPSLPPDTEPKMSQAIRNIYDNLYHLRSQLKPSTAPASLSSIEDAGAGGSDHPQSGSYTPRLTNVANLSASTAYTCQWMRVGNTVTVSGKV